MSRVCAICGKKPMYGNTIVRHGLAKAKGGIGMHTTGITKRRFMPNLKTVKMVTENGTVVHAQVCTACIKHGLVKKPTIYKRAPKAKVEAAPKAKKAEAKPVEAAKPAEPAQK
jgi:large subunit ribosomal protein L28